MIIGRVVERKRWGATWLPKDCVVFEQIDPRTDSEILHAAEAVTVDDGGMPLEVGDLVQLSLRRHDRTAAALADR